jgi:hypothetical protein
MHPTAWFSSVFVWRTLTGTSASEPQSQHALVRKMANPFIVLEQKLVKRA